MAGDLMRSGFDLLLPAIRRARREEEGRMITIGATGNKPKTAAPTGAHEGLMVEPPSDAAYNPA